MAKSGLKPKGRMTMKSSRMKGDDKASKARARMAARSKRARFFKENKKRITYSILGLIGFVVFAFFTPFGPDYYYGKLQQRKWESSGVIAPGYLPGLLKLARFYGYTFRQEQAMKTYNEIAQIYYGVPFNEFALSPTTALEKRYQKADNVAKGLDKGPPFKVPTGDVPAVGYSIQEMADIYVAQGRRGWGRNLIRDLFIGDFLEEQPNAMPSQFSENMRVRMMTY